jgi:hypothetical protein
LIVHTHPTLVYRASNPGDVMFGRELAAIATDRDATLHYVIGARAGLGYDPLATKNRRDSSPGCTGTWRTSDF